MGRKQTGFSKEALTASYSDVSRHALTPDVLKLWRRTEIAFHALVVFASIFNLSFMGPQMAGTSGDIAGGLAMVAAAETLTIRWINWSIAILIRSLFQLLAGWLLGRLIRRFNPWYIADSLIVYLGAVAIYLTIFRGIPLSRQSPEILIQIILNGVCACACIALGTWYGQYQQLTADAELTAGDSPHKVFSGIHTLFETGDNEVHEVGVISLPFGGFVFSIDGELTPSKNDKHQNGLIQSFRFRESHTLIVGSQEQHEVAVKVRVLLFWSARAFIDSQLVVKELFPEMRLLLLSVVWVVLFNVTCAVLGSLLWLGLEIYASTL